MAPYALADLELASRLSFFLWSQGPDDAAAQGLRSRGQAARPEVLRGAGRGACSRTRARRALVDELRAQVAGRRQELDAIAARSEAVSPTFTDALRQRLRRGDRARSWRACCSRTERARPADRRLHVRQRAPRAPLRDPDVRRRRSSAACTLDGSAALRAARQGRGAAAHVVRQSHVAGAARRVGARQAHGHAADAAAARRRHGSRRSRRARRRRRVRARLEQPSHEARLQSVPRRDRSDRPGARELRRHRPLARRRPRRERADRREHGARRAAAGGRARSSSRRRCSTRGTCSCGRSPRS